MSSLWLVLALCGLVGASLRPAELAPKFRSGKQYVYEWNSQVATGISDQSQHSLQRSQAQIRLHFTNEKTASVQMDQIRMAHINEELSQNLPELMPFEALKKDQTPERHIETLRLPFEIRYEQGKIISLTFDQLDKPWSENIKRAVINGFQMQMDTDELVSMYRTNETTVEGECESIYTVQKDAKCESEPIEAQKNEKKCVKVSKAINFNKCSDRSELRYNFYRAEVSARLDKKGAVEQSSMFEVELQHDKDSKLVPHFIRSVAQYAVPVSVSKELSMQAVVTNELKLKEIRPLINAPEAENKKAPQSLQYSVEFDRLREQFYENGAEDYLNQQPYLTETNIPEVVSNIAKRLAQTFVADKENDWQLDSEAAHQFANLVKMLRFASAKDLELIHSKTFEGQDIADKAQKTFIREIMSDALALAGTHPTVMHLVQKIEKKQISEQKAVSALKKLAKNIPFVGSEVIKAVWKLCEQSETGSDLQRSCLLSWSRMANTMCGVNQDEKSINGDDWAMHKRQAPFCSTEFKTELAKNLKSLIEKSESDAQQRILALKTIGNAGLENTIPELEKLINERKVERLQRIVAIDALRLIGSRLPQDIRRVLMPVVVDRTEHPEVRMNAIQQLLRSRQDKAIIDQIAVEMTRESNMNVKAFALTAMKSAAKSMENVDAVYSEHMKNAVKIMRNSLNAEQTEQLSRANSRLFSTPLNEGSMLNSAALFSNDSHIPKELMVQFDAMIFNHFLPVFEQFGLHQQNVEQLLAKFLDKLDDKTIDQIFVRGKRSSLSALYQTPVKVLKGMFEQLRIVARRGQQERPQMMFYRREQNMDTSFGYLDEQHLPQLLKDLFLNGQIDLSTLETSGERELEFVSGDFAIEQTIKIPTTGGMPLVYTALGCRVGSFRSTVKLELDGESNKVRAVKAALTLLPKISVNMIYKLEAFSPLFTTGVQTQHNVDAQLPIRAQLSYNGEKGLIVDLELPHDKEHTRKLVQASSHPSTLYRQWPQKSKIYIEHEERTLFVPQLKSLYRTIDWERDCGLSGLKEEVRGHYHHCSTADCWMAGENAFEVHTHVTDKTARKLRLHIQGSASQVQQGSTEKKHLMKLFNQPREELFTDVKSNEVNMLKEYVERFTSNANTLYELTMKVSALNVDGKAQKTASTVLKSLCDRELVSCSLDAQVDIKNESEKKWAAHVLGHVSRPALRGLYGSMRSHHVLAHAEIEWGSTEKNTMTLCAYGRPSSQSVEHSTELINLRSMGRRMKAGQFESMEEDKYEQMVMREMPTRLSPNRYTMLLEQQLTQNTLNHVRSFINYIQYASNPWSTLLRPVQTLEQHQSLRADLSVDPNQITYTINDFNQKIRSPLMNMNMFNSMEVDSQDSDSEEKTSSRRSNQRSILQKSGRHSAICTMDKEYNIHSFDGLKYKVPMTTCYTVLAKDCGSSDSKFAVMAKKITEESEQLKIKLIIPSKMYVMYEKSNKMVIEADGVVLRESEYEQYGIHTITESRRPLCVLHCDVTGMELRFDGQNVLVKLSDSYLNKQCGVCGHFNLDAQDTLRKQDNTLAKSLKEFHESYLFRGEECEPEAVQKFDKITEDAYLQSSESTESTESKKSGDEEEKSWENEYKNIKPELKTLIVEEHTLLCFSVLPHPECPRGSFAVAESDELVELDDEKNQANAEFVCWSRRQHKAQKMQRRVREEGIVSELKQEQSNKLINIQNPKRCMRSRQNNDF